MAQSHRSDALPTDVLRSEARTTWDLTVIGDSSVDYFVRVPHIAGLDNKAIGTLAGVHGGGMSANLAAAAAVHGGNVQLIAKVGGDGDGAAALRTLEQVGVHTPRTVRDQTLRTWMCLVQLDDSGEKALVGADTGIKIPALEEVDPLELQRSRTVAPLADDLTWATAIAEEAKRGGAQVAIDLEPDAFEPDQPDLRRLLEHTDIAFLNAASAAKFSTSGFADVARCLHAMGPPTVVIGAGRLGAYYFEREGSGWHAYSTRPATAVDTTGAGDALAGAFLGSRNSGSSPQRSLEWAVAQATACVTRIGSRSYLWRDSARRTAADFLHEFPVESEGI